MINIFLSSPFLSVFLCLILFLMIPNPFRVLPTDKLRIFMQFILFASKIMVLNHLLSPPHTIRRFFSYSDFTAEAASLLLFVFALESNGPFGIGGKGRPTHRWRVRCWVGRNWTTFRFLVAKIRFSSWCLLNSRLPSSGNDFIYFLPYPFVSCCFT